MSVIRENDNISSFELKLVERENWSFLRKSILFSAVVLICIYIGLKNYLFFHSLIEMLGIFIGIGVAIAVFHSSRIMKNGLYLYLGTMFLFTSIIQIIHFYSYAGINILKSDTYDLSIQISIIGKYLDVVGIFVMLIIPAYIIKKNLSINKLLVPYGIITFAVLILVVKLKIFPQCAYDNADSTPFKILSEYILLISYTLLLFLLPLKRRSFGENTFNYIFSYIALRLLSEILFASSQQVIDLASILAHILRFFAFCVIYKAVSVGVIIKPISILFDELDRKNRELEQKAIELEATNEKLRSEVQECMRIEELLTKSEKSYRELLESMPDAVVLHDREKVFFINKSGVRLYGFEDNLQVIKIELQNIFSEKRYVSFLARMDEVDKSTSPVVFEETIIRNNELICVEVISTLHSLESKSMYLSVIRDITQRKQFEEMKNSVDESNRLLMKVTNMDKLRTDYVTNLSHEFRTPLSIMLCTLKIMESMYTCESNKEIDKEKLNRYVVAMKNNSYRLLKTANNLLDITKIESGCDKLRLRNCNIVRIVEKVTMSVWEYTRNRRISLMFDTEEEEIIMACDMDKIERIMLNLLSNAVKFTKEGGQIEVYIYNKKPEVLISVSDTGIGIPKDKFELIFERFKQVDNSLSRDHEGTGIGLALVKSLVEMHDGRIEVESDLKIGSTFKVFLPIRILSGEVCLNDNETNAEIEKSMDNNINIELSNI